MNEWRYLSTSTYTFMARTETNLPVIIFIYIYIFILQGGKSLGIEFEQAFSQCKLLLILSQRLHILLLFSVGLLKHLCMLQDANMSRICLTFWW